MNRLKGNKTTVGKLFWKKRWFSICSIHGNYKQDCPRCNVGSWENIWGLAVSSFIHDHFYKIWFYYQNGSWPNHTYKDLLK